MLIKHPHQSSLLQKFYAIKKIKIKIKIKIKKRERGFWK
jgi:hypothetical protein